MTRSELEGTIKNLPTKPGVYLIKNAAGKVIYVGKAVNLRARVRSYFHDSSQQIAQNPPPGRRDRRPGVHRHRRSELEALLLENKLIKEHRPRFNVRLKDDKRYPYIKVHWQDHFPRVTIIRHILEDGARYFGPYTCGRRLSDTRPAAQHVSLSHLHTAPSPATTSAPASTITSDVVPAPCIGA